jgi:hypothetical protein
MVLELVESNDKCNKGLLVKKRDNEVIYVSYEQGTFTYIPNDMFIEKYKCFSYDKTETKYWIKTLTRKRIIYQQLNYYFCINEIDKLLKKLIRSNKILIELKSDRECPICLNDFPKNTKMVSFHEDHYKHLVCEACFKTYDKVICPICRN